ncbi:protein DOG1-like 4 [Carica papaya]|uniref:protein DOG1-like 4 n=1 Tax=Carica papaya TaxID=3649 RepID=UPI000B8C8A33|nr:protein DOG1-like 4 [Carica papaya]
MNQQRGCSGFKKFFGSWMDQLHQLVHQLQSSTALNDPNTQQRLVHSVMSHFAEYYRVKAASADVDVLNLFAAPWASTLERSLHWIAGWRPTTAFHLIYTESSILFEAHIMDILRGVKTGDLGDLSPAQFRRVSELQCETVKEENRISNELAEWQDSASDVMKSETDLEERIRQLVKVVKKADDLRIKILVQLVDLLNPQQAVEFMVAAAELQFGVRAWGEYQDRQRGSL